MGGSMTKSHHNKHANNDQLAVVASPHHGGGSSGQLPSTPQPFPLDLNTSLNDTAILFSQDSEWLDPSEMRAMEDEDAVMVRELSATTTGDLSLINWLQTRDADTKMIVRVGDTSTIKKLMGRKTIEFSIETDTGSVKRRFKDFVALRYGLEVRFPGAVVPPLPPKKAIVGKTEANFLVKRKRLLQHFLQSIARHPFLSGDDLFVEFIASTARFDRKMAWKPRDWLVKSQKWSVAARRWAQALLESETPQNAQATMEAAAGELAVVSKHLQGLKSSVKRNVHSTALMGDSLRDVAAQFSTSSMRESQLVLFSSSTTTNGTTTTTADGGLNKVFANAQSIATSNADVIRKFPEQMDEAMVSPLRFEMSFVETFQEALRRTKFSISRHRQAVSAYRQAREQSELMSSFRNQHASALQLAVPADVPQDGTASPPQTAQLLTTSNPAELEKQRKRLQRLRVSAVQAQMNARRDINGVLALELGRFRAERQLRLNKAFSDYAAVFKNQAEGLSQLWSVAAFVPGEGAAEGVRQYVYPQLGNHSQNQQNGEDEIPSRIEGGGDNNLSALLGKYESSSYIQNDNSVLSNSDAGPTSRRASQLRAKYPFQGIHEDELDVNEGEMLIGDIDDGNPEWVRARSLTTGKSGLVPKTYVEEVDEEDGHDDDFENSQLREMGENDQDEDEDDLVKKPWKDGTDNTNYIKQTQDMFKGTKRTNAERESV